LGYFISNPNTKNNIISSDDIIFNYVGLIKTTRNAQLRGFSKNSSITTGLIYIILKKDYNEYKAGTVIVAINSTKLLN
jgi:hypothetical protein